MPGVKRTRNESASRTRVARVVLADANVLYGSTLRDILMQFHADELIHVHWTRKIDDEWIRNLAADRACERNAIEYGVARLMKQNVENWEVDGYEKFEGRFPKVDLKDRHVAAAAYKLSLEEYPDQAVALVTNNLKDLPRSAFIGTAVTPQTFAAYINALMIEEPEQVARSCDRILARRKKPPKTRSDFLSDLRTRQGCRSFAVQLELHWGAGGEIEG